MGPQEVESTPWVHTAGYLRASQANSLSKLAAPAKSASSKPGSQRAESTRGSPQFPKQPACSGWCQAWPQVAAGSASQAHEQPDPQAHGGSMSKPHNAESGSTSSQAHKRHGQGPQAATFTWQGGRHARKRLSAASAKAQARVISPIHQPKLGF